MELSHSTQMALILSALAGSLHVLTPDHWIPSSLLVWQRNWGGRRAVAFSFGAFVLHILSGILIYLLFHRYLDTFESTRLFGFTLALVASVMVLRLLRYSKIKEVLQAGPRGAWGILAVLSLLGPCESIIPILIKCRQLGMGYLIPVIAFAVGTFVVGTGCMLTGRYLWSKPFLLPRGLHWASRVRTVLPMATALAIGMIAILKIT
jgi:hypothetical protein